MYATIILCTVQFVISVVSYLILRKLKKYKKDKGEKALFYHDIKSFIDAYNSLFIQNLLIIILLIIYNALLESIFEIYKNYVVIIMLQKSLMLLAIFINEISIGSMSVYSLSEIKHLSKNDELGRRCYNDTLHKVNLLDMKIHYACLGLVGLINFVSSIIQVFVLKFEMGVSYLLFMLIIFILGMADVLQHKGYNLEVHKEKRKQMSFAEKYYITNITRLFKDAKYRKKSLIILKVNTSNIVQGFKEVFSS